MWIAYYIKLCSLQHYVVFTAHHTTLFSVVTRLYRSRRTRWFLQKPTVFAEFGGSCRTRRFLQNSTVLAELTVLAARTRRILQNSMVLAEMWDARSQNSTVLVELNGSCRTRRFSQPELDGSLNLNAASTRRFL